jgi:acyl carrier protein
MNKAEQIDAKVRSLIAEHLALEHHHISDEAEFLRDFGVDWLDCLELVIIMEEHFGIEIPDDRVDEVRAVGDLIRLIELHSGSGRPEKLQ